MTGLALSRRYFETAVLPALRGALPACLEFLAAGLVGEGSECLGLDDEQSRDHDWGAGVCIWLPAEAYARFGAEIEALLGRQDAYFEGFPVRPPDGVRVGVFEIGAFYHRFLGCETPPRDLRQWARLPAVSLCAATNGAVFCDEPGLFSAIRQTLSACYPTDILLKKLEHACFVMAQAGQYNFPRIAARGQATGALAALAAFQRAALDAVFFLNRRYPPFYKWSGVLCAELPLGGAALHRLLEETASLQVLSDAQAVTERIAHICRIVRQQLGLARFPMAADEFLMEQAHLLHRHIQTPWLRDIPVGLAL